MGLSSARGRSAEIGMAGAFFVQGISNTLMIPRVPELIDQIGVEFTTWGLIIGLAGLGSLLGLTVSSKLISRFGTRLVVRWGAILAAGFMMTLPFVHDAWLFFAAQLGMSFVGACVGVAINAQAVALQKLLNRVVIGKFHGSWSIGAALSVAFSGSLALVLSLAMHFLILGSICIVALFITTHYMLTPEEVGKSDDRKFGKKVSFFKTPKQVWLLTAGLFAGMFPEICLMDWSAVFAKTEIGVNASLGAMPYTVFGIAMIIGRLSIGRLTKRFHISELSKWGGIFGSVALGLGVWLGPTLAASDHILGLVVLVALWSISGLGMAPMVPSFFSGAGYVKGLQTAQALARMTLVNAIVMMGAKIVMGGIAQGVDLQVAFIFPTVMMFVAGFIAHVVAKRAKRAEAVANAFPPTGPISIVQE